MADDAIDRVGEMLARVREALGRVIVGQRGVIDEALLCLAEQEGPAAVPDLVAWLLANARRTERRLGGLPMYRGCAMVMYGIVEARRGRSHKARALFARALAIRPAGREMYLDTWMLWRTAFERRRMGDARELLQAQLHEVERINKDSQLGGMAMWLAAARLLYDV